MKTVKNVGLSLLGLLAMGLTIEGYSISLLEKGARTPEAICLGMYLVLVIVATTWQIHRTIKQLIEE